MNKAVRLKVELPPDKDLGTVTFKTDYQCNVFGDKFSAGQTVKIGKAMLSPFGEGYYKVFGTKVWVTSKEVTNVTVTLSQRRTYRSVL